jgi:hypothetical protein
MTLQESAGDHPYDYYRQQGTGYYSRRGLPMFVYVRKVPQPPCHPPELELRAGATLQSNLQVQSIQRDQSRTWKVRRWAMIDCGQKAFSFRGMPILCFYLRFLYSPTWRLLNGFYGRNQLRYLKTIDPTSQVSMDLYYDSKNISFEPLYAVLSLYQWDGASWHLSTLGLLTPRRGFSSHYTPLQKI